MLKLPPFWVSSDLVQVVDLKVRVGLNHCCLTRRGQRDLKLFNVARPVRSRFTASRYVITSVRMQDILRKVFGEPRMIFKFCSEVNYIWNSSDIGRISRLNNKLMICIRNCDKAFIYCVSR